VQHSVAVLDRRADGDEFGHVLSPVIAPDVQAYAHHSVSVQCVCLLFHARHRQLASLVHGLGEHVHLLALPPARHLDTDVVDGAAHHQSQGLEAGLLHEQELVDGEVGGEEPTPVLLQAGSPGVGHPLQRRRVIAHGLAP